MSDPTSEGHPVGPELDDSQNPTFAAPAEDGTQASEPASARAPGQPAGGEPIGDHPESAEPPAGGETQRASRDMLQQLQQMIDSAATQAGPVMRQVAAKAAELAAVAGERAGPLAHRAAEATERVGVRVAARSKVMASDLRRQANESGTGESGAQAEAGAGVEPSAEDPEARS